MALLGYLTQAQLPVVVVNPRQVRDFAKALGKLAKTDTLDVRVLASFGEATKPQQRPLPDAQAQEIAKVAGSAASIAGDVHCRKEPAGHSSAASASPAARTY